MKKTMMLAAASLLAFTTTPVQATEIIGAGSTGFNCFPFGCAGVDASTRYQQVYSSAEFSGALAITGISFYAGAGFANDLNDGNFAVSLSTTGAAVDGLDNVDLDNNVGIDEVLLFNGMLPVLDGSGTLTLNFSSTFNYDPNAGNLLLDVVNDGLGNSGSASFFQAFNGDANGIFSRAHNYDGTGQEGWGLTTGFETGIGGIPEPTTWAMLIFGFGAVGGAMRSRRKANVKVSYA